MKEQCSFLQKGTTRKFTRENNCCHKYGKPKNFIKEYPFHKMEYKGYVKNTQEWTYRRNQVHGKLKRREVADKIIKQVLAAWGDTSNRSKPNNDREDTSMLVVNSKPLKFDSYSRLWKNLILIKKVMLVFLKLKNI